MAPKRQPKRFKKRERMKKGMELRRLAQDAVSKIDETAQVQWGWDQGHMLIVIFKRRDILDEAKKHASVGCKPGHYSVPMATDFIHKKETEAKDELKKAIRTAIGKDTPVAIHAYNRAYEDVLGVKHVGGGDVRNIK